jgi:hypothetical protein
VRLLASQENDIYDVVDASAFDRAQVVIEYRPTTASEKNPILKFRDGAMYFRIEGAAPQFQFRRIPGRERHMETGNRQAREVANEWQPATRSSFSHDHVCSQVRHRYICTASAANGSISNAPHDGHCLGGMSGS